MNTTKWIVDPLHSEIHFKVKHQMISNITGHFKQFSVSAETAGDDFSKVTNIVFAADVKFGGIAGDLYGQIKAGFTISGKLSRKEFGITYNATTESGGVLIGDEVKFGGEIQLIKQVEKN